MATKELSEKDYLQSIWHNLNEAAKGAAKVTFALETNDILDSRLNQILSAINSLNSMVQAMPAPVVNLPAPIVNVPQSTPPTIIVDPPDLSAIVTAVTGLKPGADASAIAEAIVAKLSPPPPERDDTVLTEVVKALEKLDFRMRGVGSQAYGGGASQLNAQRPDGSFSPAKLNSNGELVVTTTSAGGGLTDTQLRATPVPVSGSFGTPDVTDRAARLLGHVTVDSAPTTAVTGTFWQATQPVSLATAPTTPVTGTFWQATQPVSLAATVATKEVRSATGTQSSVASSATTVTLLASNANRLGATFYNDSTQILYLKLGATASATSYSIQLPANGYYEIPNSYTGVVDGIWASANGNARVTELT